jgi:hypothetical protein
LLSITASLSNAYLYVYGTTGDDTVRMGLKAGDPTSVLVRDATTVIDLGPGSAGAINYIYYWGKGGNDDVAIDETNGVFPSSLHGTYFSGDGYVSNAWGTGTDTFTAGSQGYAYMYPGTGASGTGASTLDGTKTPNSYADLGGDANVTATNSLVTFGAASYVLKNVSTLQVELTGSSGRMSTPRRSPAACTSSPPPGGTH